MTPVKPPVSKIIKELRGVKLCNCTRICLGHDKLRLKLSKILTKALADQKAGFREMVKRVTERFYSGATGLNIKGVDYYNAKDIDDALDLILEELDK